jgi:shikimate kinase
VVDDTPFAVLIGPPGAGKSRIGKRVAAELDVPFIDTDRRIVEKHGPIADIFAASGEAFFRAVEREEVATALRERAVVSLGGGAVLDETTQAELRECPVVFLTVTPHAVAARLGGAKRPLIGGNIERWTALERERAPIYASLADYTVDTSTRPATLLAEEIAAWIKESLR